MVAYTFYESDSRVRQYAETLARRGDHVDVISLRGKEQKSLETLNGVNVYRIQERMYNEKGKLTFLGRLLKFLVKSTIFLSRKHLERPYDLIHIHSVPDFEVFAACLPKLFGAKIILDIHDIVPEFYASKFETDKNSILFKGLLFLEKVSIWFADHVIIANHIWEKTLVRRSAKPTKCSTVLNYPDPYLFYPRHGKKENGKIVMMFPGTLNWHQGLDIAIKAFNIIKTKTPEAEFHIYGTGGEKDDLVTLVQDLGLQDSVLFKGVLSLDKIVEVMATADIGIVPKRNDSFGGEAFSTKILEFMSLGVPLIVSRTKIDTYYFNDSVVKFFTPEDVDSLAEAMLTMSKNQHMRKTFAENALKFIGNFCWEKRKEDYLNLVDRLVKR
jgi:glycosyltransferase involved in cell wall biosynthesis